MAPGGIARRFAWQLLGPEPLRGLPRLPQASPPYTIYWRQRSVGHGQNCKKSKHTFFHFLRVAKITKKIVSIEPPLESGFSDRFQNGRRARRAIFPKSLIVVLEICEIYQIKGFGE